MLYCKQKARCFCEKSNLYYQQHSALKLLYFDLVDGICRSIVLHHRPKLSSICGGSVLVCGFRYHYPHTHLLHFGNRSIYCKMEKRTLPWRILGSIFALWNDWNFYPSLPCAHIFRALKVENTACLSGISQRISVACQRDVTFAVKSHPNLLGDPCGA